MKGRPRPQNGTTRPRIGIELLLASVGLFALGLLLIWFATLRENPVFWTYAGGYPIWLRELVLRTYWVLFLLDSMCLIVLSLVCGLRICGPLRGVVFPTVMLAACWGLVAVSGAIAVKNNVLHFINGDPRHAHRNTRLLELKNRFLN